MTAYTVLRNRLASWLGYSHDGDRDLYASFGYKRILMMEDLYAMYRRNDIAYRIINAYPQATWADMPLIRDEKGGSSAKKDNTGTKNKDFSPFVQAVEELFDRLKIMDYLERADRVSQLGRYGVLVMGFAGSDTMAKPLGKGKKELMYLVPYAENACRVVEWCTDTSDPRFGLPTVYEVNPSRDVNYGEKSLPSQSFRVHHTRVLHLAEQLDQDEVFGVPRLEPIYNRLKDLEKVMGGAAECFWLNANRGIHFDVDKDTNLTVEQITDAKQQASDFTNQLKRHILTQGVTANVMGSDVADVEPTFTALLQLIAGSSGIPQRILLGSEAGELASSQDENNWSDRIGERRNSFATRRILEPFIQLMIDTGNLPAPKGCFWVEWPETQVSEDKKADIGLKKTQALTAYANSPSAPLIMPEQEFRKTILDLPPVSEYESEVYDEMQPEPTVDPVTGEPLDAPQDKAAEDDAEEKPKPTANGRRAMFVNMKPEPLYVMRPLLNANFVKKHFATLRSMSGFTPVEDLHVTLCYSKTPVDWLKVSEDWGQDENGRVQVKPGGARKIEQWGNAVVLSFSNSMLQWRHQQIKDACGISHDFPTYQPHVTLGHVADGVKLNVDDVPMFNEALVLGPETFEAIDAEANA